MKLKTEVSITKSNLNLNVGDGVMLLGSCFSDNIGGKLRDFKFDCCINPFGVLYNPRSIRNAVDCLLQNDGFDPDSYLFRSNGLWNSWLHSGEFSAVTKEECIGKISKSLHEGYASLKTAKLLIITFGTNRYYACTNDKGMLEVANCHKMPHALFCNHDMTADEIGQDFSVLVNNVRQINPDIKVLFTVSPYRYTKYGLHENNLSKAMLLLGTDKLVSKFKGRCYYFPSFEIMNDELRDYRFYADDMLHPSSLAVEYIFEQFAEYAFAAETQRFCEEWKKVIKVLKHFPLNPEADEYRAFLNNTKAYVLELSQKYMHLDAAEELDELDKRINQYPCKI